MQVCRWWRQEKEPIQQAAAATDGRRRVASTAARPKPAIVRFRVPEEWVGVQKDCKQSDLLLFNQKGQKNRNLIDFFPTILNQIQISCFLLFSNNFTSKKFFKRSTINGWAYGDDWYLGCVPLAQTLPTVSSGLSCVLPPLANVGES